MTTWLVTGGAGFLGAALVRALRRQGRVRVVTLDLLTYAGDRARLAGLEQDPDHVFVQGDVADRGLVRRLLDEHRPAAVLHLAAETHVDRSIDRPADFVHANAGGTLHLLEAVRGWWQAQPAGAREAFRLVLASTDEVYGSLGPAGRFTAASPHAPRSPYAASKAAADHLAQAWHATWGLPTLVSHGSNTYGPWQLPEKFLPLLLLKALRGERIPVYGDGAQVREWMHVDDHAAALARLAEAGVPGEPCLVGGGEECTNLEVATRLCAALDRAHPQGAPHARLLEHVPDRPGHDRRYALDGGSAHALGWRPLRRLSEGLDELAAWAVRERGWLERMAQRDGVGVRLGLGGRA